MNYNNKSSPEDLYKIADKIGLSNLLIIRKKDLKKALKDKNNVNIIINLDDVNNGSHWCALNTKKKMYFDSYNMEPPNIIKNYKSYTKNFQIQSILSDFCGQVCCLFLYYCERNKIDEFYSLFRDTLED